MSSNANKLVVGTGSGDQGMSVFAGTSTGRYAFARAVGDNTDAYDGGMAYDGSRNLTFHTNANTERMRIDGSGNVGIGTSSPTKRLTIGDSDATAFIASGGNNTHLTLSANGGSGAVILRTGGTNGDPDTTTERMRVDSSGNLLVGKSITNTNTNGLTVSPNDFISYTNSATDSGDRCMLLNRHAVNAGDLLSFRTQNADRGIISFNGSVMSYGGTSDYRLKENIKPMENGLERLNRLNPVSFNWKETGINSEGFIAHEVQEVFADVVTGEKDGKQMQTVDYGRITPLLVKAIQEQQEQIETLKSEIKILKGE